MNWLLFLLLWAANLLHFDKRCEEWYRLLTHCLEDRKNGGACCLVASGPHFFITLQWLAWKVHFVICYFFPLFTSLTLLPIFWLVYDQDAYWDYWHTFPCPLTSRPVLSVQCLCLYFFSKLESAFFLTHSSSRSPWLGQFSFMQWIFCSSLNQPLHVPVTRARRWAPSLLHIKTADLAANWFSIAFASCW